jgi:hypothetical protein
MLKVPFKRPEEIVSSISISSDEKEEEEHRERVDRRKASSKKRCERGLIIADGLENDSFIVLGECNVTYMRSAT